ncbi:MAG: glycoside hydrolase family 3 N-terminal domain-containing protein [Pseudomonadota bacterium]
MARRSAIFGCAGPALLPPEAAFFRDADPFGFILFARNIETPDQLRALTSDLRAAVGWDAPILIDQEGGRVARMTAPHWRRFPPALDQADKVSPGDFARSFNLRGLLIADDLMSVGIDVNCTPLADIAEAATHPVLLNRLYGRSPAAVTEAARALAEGQADAGVSSVLKHLPGYGRASVDGHLDLPRVSVGRAELDAWDFAPFKALSDMPMGMTAHIVLDVIDKGQPATVSATCMKVIRQDIGFDGLLMTDDISMEALSGSVTERAQASLIAGCDVVLHCNGDLAEMQALAAVCPVLTGPAATRAETALAARPKPAGIDIAACEAEFNAMFKAQS